MPDHPDRVWRLQGATNFRDLGGYRGLDGRTLRWRRLFRSEHLAGLSAADHALIRQLGIARSFDFRGVAERAATPYELPGVTQHHLAIEPTVGQRMSEIAAMGGRLDAAQASGMMDDLYRSLVNDQAHRYAELFAHLLETDAPVLFHCTAGKDRTGFAAALILLSLGVPREVVMQDFLLTNLHFKHPVMQESDTPPEVVAVLWSVQQRFLDAALHAIDTDHGGIDRYLADRMGLNPAARALLVERYLEAVSPR